MIKRFIDRLKDNLKGGVTMMVMLFAINIAKDEFKFSRVPKRLKDAVKKQLEMMDLDEKTLAELLAK